MKKRILRIGLMAVLALSLIGCGIGATKTVTDIEYEVLNTVPEGIVTLGNRGYKVLKHNNEFVVIILTGEKPSSGYGIEVQSIKDTGGKIEIIVNETEPKPDEMIATVLTYPGVAIKIGNTITPKFVVSNSKGDRFENIDQ